MEELMSILPRLAAVIMAAGICLPHGQMAGMGRGLIMSFDPLGVPAATSCAAPWRLLAGAPAGTSALNGIGAVSARDIWVVGASGLGNASVPLAEHWDGRRWQDVATPSLGSRPATFDPNAPGAAFTAVAAVSTGDVWAVGHTRTDAAGSRPLAEHWDGHRWRRVGIPDAGQASALSAVSATSTHDVWAVGTIGGRRTLVEHWDGRAWRAIPTPPLSGQEVGLSGVAALSSTDVWAVGSRGSVSAGRRRSLVERWDGRRWHVLPSPQPGVVDDALSAVAAHSATDVWAVGLAEGNDYVTGPLVEHWTGAAWRVVPSPPLPDAQGAGGLTAVAEPALDDVWVAAGGTLARWTGQRWLLTRLRTSTYSGGTDTGSASTAAIAAVAEVAPAEVWVAGQVLENTDQQHTALIAQYGPPRCHGT
jgi:hypothetical protein